VRSVDSWLRRHPWLGDLALVAVFLVEPQIERSPRYGPVWLQAAVFAGLVAPLLWRRRFPGAVAALVVAAFVGQVATGVWFYFLPTADLAVLVAVYSALVHGRRRHAVAAAGAAGAALLIWSVGYVTLLRAAGFRTAWALFPPALFAAALAGAWLLGELRLARRAYLRELEQRLLLAEAAQQAAARAAAAEERARLARELHDAVASAVSTIVLHADGARLRVGPDGHGSDRVLETIAGLGRSALDELRRLVDVLRVAPADPAPLSATELDRLVRVGTAGRPVELHLTGTTAELPGDVAHQLRRILQEALVNVAKHAPADARVAVEVDLDHPGPRRRVRLRVDNDRAGGPPPPAGVPSGGHGTASMRERVAMLGGSLSAGAHGDGGYRVEAVIPAPASVPRRRRRAPEVDSGRPGRPLRSSS
jgi:signal transduction histidine kinase